METPSQAVVGRDEELERIARFLDRGDCSGLLLEGEPGIGKTTLWEAGAAVAEHGSLRVLRTRPAEAETALAFVALADLLGDALDDVQGELPPPQRRALRGALLLEDETVLGRRVVATAVLGAVRALARDGVAICVDDVQWLDASSAGALAFAARRLGGERALFLLARRLGAGAGGVELEDALPNRLERVRVGPLGVDALNELLAARLGRSFPRPLLSRIAARSAGNPFFALELARALGDGDEDEVLPESLEGLLRGRLDVLPVKTRAALAAAAATSRPTLMLLQRALETDALARLAPAVDSGVVHVRADGAIVFEHPLLAAAALAPVGVGERRSLHRRLAAAVGELEERARHLALAADGPDGAVAAVLDEAARSAHGRGATAEAGDLAEHAAVLTPADDPVGARRRRLDAAWFHFESGDGRRARALAEQVHSEAPPGERAPALYLLARFHSYDDDLARARDVFLEVISEAGEDEHTAARAHEGVAATLFRLRTSFAEAVEHARAAVRLAERTDDRALRAVALGTQLVAEATLGRSEAVDTLTLARDAQPDAVAERAIAQPAFTASVFEMWRERLDEARAGFTALLERGRALGDESSGPYVLVLLAQTSCFAGDFADAAAHARDATTLADQAGQETLRAYGLALGAYAEAHRGRAEARSLAAEARDVGARTAGAPATQFAHASLGLLELSLGRAKEAHAVLEPLVAWARTEEMCEPGLTRFARDDTEALLAIGRLDDAEELLAWWGGHAEQLGRRGALADAYRCRGLLMAARGSRSDALEAFAVALEHHAAVALPFARARTLLAFGAALRREKRKREARASLEEAVREFERMDAAVFADQARKELATIGGRTSAGLELTPTEARVAELVAAGRANKEVAAALFLTTKTVEFHLRNVFRKLDVRSRTELAARYRP